MYNINNFDFLIQNQNILILEKLENIDKQKEEKKILYRTM